MKIGIKCLGATMLIVGVLIVALQQRVGLQEDVSMVNKATEPSRGSERQVPSAKTPPHKTLAQAAGKIDQKPDVVAPDLATFNAFDAWFATYENAGPTRSELEAEGEKIALERRAALAALIPVNPELALQLAVPYERRKVLPQSIVRHLEETVSGVARYEVVAFAPGTRPRGSSSVERYATLNDRTYTASVYGRRVTLPSKASITLHGIAIAEALAVAEHPVRVLGAVEAEDRLANTPDSDRLCPISTAPGSAAHGAEIGGEVRYFCHNGHIAALNAELEELENSSSAPAPNDAPDKKWTQGDKSLLFIRVNFPDDLTERISESEAKRLLAEVNAFLAFNSYGTLSISGTVTPVLTLPLPKASYRASENAGINFANILKAARTAAFAAGFDTSEYDLDCVHLDGNIVSARGYVGMKGATLQDNNAGAACHELGHNLGLWHANGWRSSDGSITGTGVNAEYANYFDTMGYGSNTRAPFNAYSRHFLGWLPENTVQTITEDGIYTLYPFDVAAIESGRAYALKLRKDDARDYWIETREDGNGELLIHWSPWYLSNGGTQLLDTTPSSEGGFYDALLKPGASFYDPELGLKIIPLRSGANTAGAVDVLVKHVHYLAAAEEDPNLSNDPNNGVSGSAVFTVDVAAAGVYTLWCRTLGPWSAMTVTLDGHSSQLGDSWETANAKDWRWTRVLSSGVPISLPLATGRHTLFLRGENGLTKVDSILLAEDPTPEFPPIFGEIPAQTAIFGERTVITSLFFSPDTKLGGTKFTATSGNQNVVPDLNISIAGSGGKVSIEITPHSLGETSISLRATTADGRSGVISFNLSVIGAVQHAIDSTPPGEAVRLPAGTYIDHVLIDRDLTLEGSGTTETILDGNRDGTTLTISEHAVVTLKNLTIRNGTGGIVNSGLVHVVECEITQNINSSRGGGGIWNGPGAEMTVERSTISSNRCSGYGGGIYNFGHLRLSDSTVSANRSALKDGGGISNSGALQVVHCTVAFNRARGGGGIANLAGLELGNTLVAGNMAEAESSNDLKGVISSQGYNLFQTTMGAEIQGDLTTVIIGQDPLLGPLMNNGGSTCTHALLKNSPAIDSGDSGGLEVDQRQFSRVSDAGSVPNVSDGSDIGAYEFVPDDSDLAPVSGTSVNPAITLHRDDNGDLVVSVEGGSGADWIVLASSDFASWDLIGLLRQGQMAGLKDPGARNVSHRFYRIIRY